MIISHKYKFIFLKTRKTAGTSIEVMLSSICGSNDVFTPIYPCEPDHVPRNYRGLFNPLPELYEKPYQRTASKGLYSWRRTLSDLRYRRRFYNHMTAELARCRIKPEIWRSYIKWCVEREPIEKCESYYKMIAMNNKNQITPTDYLRDHRLPINSPIYTDCTGNIIVDRILRYDDLENELHSLFKELDIPFQGLTVHAKKRPTEPGHMNNSIFTNKEQDLILQKFNKEQAILAHYGIEWRK